MKAGEASQGVDSPYWRAGHTAREQQKPTRAGQPARLKRAILPAAISDSAAIRLLAEAESREQSSFAVTGRKTERDDRQEQNSAYSPSTILTLRCL